MRIRPLLATVVAAAALATVPVTAQARSVENIDRRIFDSSPEVSASSLHLDGSTAGELGGFLDLVVTAKDGSLPTEQGACDRVHVDAVLTVSPGEQLTVHTRGEVCMHQFSPTLILNASFRNRHATYSGTAHRKVRVVGDGLIAASNSLGYGYGASFSSAVRW